MHTVVQVLIDGKVVPDIWSKCISANKSICDIVGVRYFLYKQTWKKEKFVCAGYQAECLKTTILSSDIDTIVCDCDTEIIDLEKILSLKKSDYPYVGKWGEPVRNPDSFVSFCNTRNAAMVFSDLAKAQLKHIQYAHSFFKSNKNLNEIPDEAYRHYHTDCGFPKIKTVDTVVDKINSLFPV
jgi:hypothetical protein